MFTKINPTRDRKSFRSTDTAVDQACAYRLGGCGCQNFLGNSGGKIFPQDRHLF
ncbi:MAG: hypothetical protein ACHBN1_16680 [Heteroscytonema crispum UTEX LB 1556]